MGVNRSIDIPLQQGLQGSNSSFRVRTVGDQHDGGSGDNTHGHDAQQTLGVHLPIVRLQPNGAGKLIGLLHEICSLLVVQSRLAANNDLLIVHN